MKMLAGVLVAIIGLSGCASMKAAQRARDAQEKQASCDARWQASVPLQEAEYEDFMEKSGLRTKIPQDFRKMTYEQRTNPDRPTEIERQNLGTLVHMRTHMALERMGLLVDCMPREELAVYQTKNKADTEDYQDLQASRITFGELLQRLDDRQKKFVLEFKMAQTKAKRRASEEESYRAEQDRTADAQTAAAVAAGLSAAGAAMAEASRPVIVQPATVIVQPVVAQPALRMTSCSGWGNRIDCVSF